MLPQFIFYTLFYALIKFHQMGTLKVIEILLYHRSVFLRTYLIVIPQVNT